jgi:hypothetical protein
MAHSRFAGCQTGKDAYATACESNKVAYNDGSKVDW